MRSFFWKIRTFFRILKEEILKLILEQSGKF